MPVSYESLALAALIVTAPPDRVREAVVSGAGG